MAIRFEKIRSDYYRGFISETWFAIFTQKNGKIFLSNVDEDIELQELEQILSKMKELQREVNNG